MKRTALLIAWLLLPVAAVLNAEEPAGEGTLEVFVRDEDGDLTPAMVSINTLPDGLPITFGIDTMRAVKFREKHAEIDPPRFYPLVLFLADTGGHRFIWPGERRSSGFRTKVDGQPRRFSSTATAT